MNMYQFIFACFLLSILGCNAPPSADNQKAKTQHRKNDLGWAKHSLPSFSFRHPSDWKVKPASSLDGKEAVFATRVDPDIHGFRPNVSFQYYNFDPPFDKLENWREKLEKVSRDENLYDIGWMDVSGKTFLVGKSSEDRQHLSAATRKAMPLTHTSYQWIDRDVARLYLVTLTANDDDLSGVAVAERIVLSLNIKSK